MQESQGTQNLCRIESSDFNITATIPKDTVLVSYTMQLVLVNFSLTARLCSINNGLNLVLIQPMAVERYIRDTNMSAVQGDFKT